MLQLGLSLEVVSMCYKVTKDKNETKGSKPHRHNHLQLHLVAQAMKLELLIYQCTFLKKKVEPTREICNSQARLWNSLPQKKNPLLWCNLEI